MYAQHHQNLHTDDGFVIQQPLFPIIGITGTIGAGKGAAVSYLQQKGFTHYSIREVLLQEVSRRGLATDRTGLQEAGNALRAEHGAAFLVERAYAQAQASGAPAVIESIRALAEAEFLQKSGAYILAVDADRALRYERIHSRGLPTDHVDFDTWVKQEECELASTDPNGMNVIGVMARANWRIENDGSLTELHQKLDSLLTEIGYRAPTE